jgi:hypothetical protein
MVPDISPSKSEVSGENLLPFPLGELQGRLALSQQVATQLSRVTHEVHISGPFQPGMIPSEVPGLTIEEADVLLTWTFRDFLHSHTRRVPRNLPSVVGGDSGVGVLQREQGS